MMPPVDNIHMGHYLLFMKTYDDISNTPLRFHRIYASVVLPIDLFLNLYSLITIVSELTNDTSSLLTWITLLMSVVFIVLIIIAFRSLLVFKKKGIYALSALLLLQILDNGYTFYLSWRASEFVFMASSALSIIILSFILGYYFLRRKIFTKEGIDIRAYMEGMRRKEEMVKEEIESTEPTIEEEEESVGEYDCPRCGFHISDGKVFCPKCGAQTRSVRR